MMHDAQGWGRTRFTGFYERARTLRARSYRYEHFARRYEQNARTGTRLPVFLVASGVRSYPYEHFARTYEQSRSGTSKMFVPARADPEATRNTAVSQFYEHFARTGTSILLVLVRTHYRGEGDHAQMEDTALSAATGPCFSQ